MRLSPPTGTTRLPAHLRFTLRLPLCCCPPLGQTAASKIFRVRKRLGSLRRPYRVQHESRLMLPFAKQVPVECTRSTTAKIRRSMNAMPSTQADAVLGSRHRRDDHNFNQHPGSPKFGREASARRWVYRIDPLVPHRVVVFEQTHVRNPDLGA